MIDLILNYSYRMIFKLLVNIFVHNSYLFDSPTYLDMSCSTSGIPQSTDALCLSLRGARSPETWQEPWECFSLRLLSDGAICNGMFS